MIVKIVQQDRAPETERPRRGRLMKKSLYPVRMESRLVREGQDTSSLIMGRRDLKTWPVGSLAFNLLIILLVFKMYTSPHPH